MPTFETPGPISAAVLVAGAQVRLAATDRADTVVLVEPIDPANTSDVKVASRTRVDFSAGQLTVKTTVSGDKKGSVAITIDLPAGSGLITDLAYSAVHAEGALGEVELHLASGRAQLDRVATLQASVARGEVAVGSIAGRAVITGSAVVARIGQAAAGLEFSTASGSVDIDRADGNVTATSGDAAIRIGRLTSGQAELTNRSGTIEVGVSAGTAARVDASSERASVRNSVPSPADPGPFDAQVAVRARSRHGDIIIARAAS